MSHHIYLECVLGLFYASKSPVLDRYMSLNEHPKPLKSHDIQPFPRLPTAVIGV